MELYWAHRGSICCFQDFLKEKNKASVSEGQCWERVKWGRLPHTGKAPTAAQSTQGHPEESAPNASWGLYPAASPAGSPGTLVIPGLTLTAGTCSYPLLFPPQQNRRLPPRGSCINHWQWLMLQLAIIKELLWNENYSTVKKQNKVTYTVEVEQSKPNHFILTNHLKKNSNTF